MREVSSLQNIALKNICRNIAKHGLQYSMMADKTPYFKLQRKFAEKILEIINEISCMRNNHEESEDFDICLCPEGSKKVPRESLDLIFNMFVKNIDLSSTYFEGEIASTVSRNCKNLLRFTIRGAELSLAIYGPLFRSIGKLTVLTLRRCRKLSLEILEEVANSLIHLRSLTLQGTYVGNRGLFVLSGHKPRDVNLRVSHCCYTKSCNVNSPLVHLENVHLSHYFGNNIGFAYLLTHVPTLKQIFVTFANAKYFPLHTVSNAVYKIHAKRAKFGLPRFSYNMEYLDKISAENTAYILPSCSRLKELVTTVGDNLGEVLANNQLEYLQHIILHYRNCDQLLTGKFTSFWKTKGHRLTRLSLIRETKSEGRFATNCNNFSTILTLCPNLEILHLNESSFLESETVEDIPPLRHLGLVWLTFESEVDAAKALAHKIIRSAVNVIQVRLIIPGGKKYFLDLLTTQSFPKLKIREVYGD